MLEAFDFTQFLNLGELEAAAERIVRNRLLIAAGEFETGSEDYEKVMQVSDTVKAHITSNGNSVSLTVEYDTTIASSSAYLAMDEGYAMLDVFFPSWVEDSLDENNPQFSSAIEEYVMQEITSRLGGG